MSISYRKRKARVYETTCTCNAYKFPHRFGGGKCDGYYLAEEIWNQNWGEGICANCNLNNNGVCEVYSGQESPSECPGVQEFVRYNEIRIYK